MKRGRYHEHFPGPSVGDTKRISFVKPPRGKRNSGDSVIEAEANQQNIKERNDEHARGCSITELPKRKT